MAQWIRFSNFATDSAGRAASTYRYVSQQPSWVVRAALWAFIIVIGLPILLLLLLAMTLAVIVFGTLALINAVLVRIRGGLPRHDGRSNVRVIDRN